VTDDLDRQKLAELLATPVTREHGDPGDEDLGPRRDPGVWLALLIGAAVVLVGFVIGRLGADSETTPTTGAPPTSSPTATTSPPSAVETFPAGYAQVADMVGAKAMRAVILGDELHVTLSTIYRAGFDPEVSDQFDGGRWEVVLDDGRRFDSKGQFLDPFETGSLTVVFPVDGYTADDLASMELAERWFTRRQAPSAELEVSGFPYETEDAGEVDLGNGVVLSMDRVELSDDGGTLVWSLGGDPAAEAVVAAVVELRIGFNDFTPEVMIPVGTASAFFFSDEQQAREGAVELTRPTLEDSSELFSATINWQVTLFEATAASAVVSLRDL
jgi:hypothetical protein